MEHENALSAKEIMEAITETQQNVVRLREARTALEVNMADLDRQIDNDVTVLAELQEALNKAIAQATHKAVGG